ncbi:MAG TPA: SIS domain-containing protein, partial [Bacteroidetes bacterium]|nr:SIS domain-containing protein [Bacteroidota bacterium]HEX03632.1 SIS domain-containing protein [Bacteroidota bacterium]
MDMNAAYSSRLTSHRDVTAKMDSLQTVIVEAVEMVVDTFRQGNKLLLAGNGGSAADAQHWAAEWIIRLSADLNRPSMPAIALTTDSSILTAGANDLGYEQIFARQIEGLGNRGDLFITISTSGNSTNLLKACEAAHANGLR